MGWMIKLMADLTMNSMIDLMIDLMMDSMMKWLLLLLWVEWSWGVCRLAVLD
jgi:hypothetical protein